MTRERKNLLGKKALILGSDLGFLNAIEKRLSFLGIEVMASRSIKNSVSDIKSLKPDFVIVECTVNDNQELVNDLNDLAEHAVPIILVATDLEKDVLLNYKYIIDKSKLNFSNLLNLIEKSLRVKGNKDFNRSNIDISETRSLPVKKENAIEMRVLIFEDDPLLRDMLSVKFIKSKIPFKFCHNGLDASKILIDYKPTLVLLDIMLPGKNGLDVLKELRDDETYSKLPVIVFSNKDTDKDRQLASKLGASDFLVKATTNLNYLVELILEKHDCPFTNKR